MKTLLVGLSAEWLALVSAALQARGHDQLHAASADEALALLQTVAPELIVVEDPLAGMGAVEFCRRVRALPEVEDAVVLVITQRSEDPELVLDAGATDLYPTTMGASFGHSDGRKVGQVFG